MEKPDKKTEKEVKEILGELHKATKRADEICDLIDTYSLGLQTPTQKIAYFSFIIGYVREKIERVKE